MNAHQSAEAPIKDAEAPLVVGDLHESLHVPVVVGTNNSVCVRVDLVNPAGRHLQAHRLPRVTPVVLEAVVTLLDARDLKRFSHTTLEKTQIKIQLG